jgi:hypothetical protein
MKTKSIFLRSALLLLVVTMIAASIFAANTTLAQYSATATGRANAEIALFDVDLLVGATTHNVTTWSDEMTFDLFATIREWSGVSQGPPSLGTAGQVDAHVLQNAAGTENIRIAPGTQGSFMYRVNNLSEVSIRVTPTVTIGTVVLAESPRVAYGALEGPANQAALQTAIEARIVFNPTTIAVQDLTWVGNTATGTTTTTGDRTITWEWVFTTSAANDAIDTWIGLNARHITIPVTFSLRADQID